jgi:hypothetical protein
MSLPDSWRLAPSGKRYGKDTPLINPLLKLFKAGLCHQLIHFGLRASPHHPGATSEVASQRARNEF